MATTKTGQEIIEVQLYDHATQRAVESWVVRGDLYRHVTLYTQAMKERLRLWIETGTLSPPKSRYEVRWIVEPKIESK